MRALYVCWSDCMHVNAAYDLLLLCVSKISRSQLGQLVATMPAASKADPPKKRARLVGKTPEPAGASSANVDLSHPTRQLMQDRSILISLPGTLEAIDSLSRDTGRTSTRPFAATSQPSRKWSPLAVFRSLTRRSSP